MRKPTWDAEHAPNGQRRFFQSQTFCLRCFAKYEDANERTQVAELSWRNGRRNPHCKLSSVRWSETGISSWDSRNHSMSTLLYLALQLGNGGLGGQSRRWRRGLRSFNYVHRGEEEEEEAACKTTLRRNNGLIATAPEQKSRQSSCAHAKYGRVVVIERNRNNSPCPSARK